MWVFLAQLSISKLLVCAMRRVMLSCSEVLYEIRASPLSPTLQPPFDVPSSSSVLCTWRPWGLITAPPSHPRGTSRTTVLFVSAQNAEHTGHDTGVCLKSLFIPQTYTSPGCRQSTLYQFHPCWWHARSAERACCIKLIKSWNVTEGRSLYLAPSFLHARGLGTGRGCAIIHPAAELGPQLHHLFRHRHHNKS